MTTKEAPPPGGDRTTAEAQAGHQQDINTNGQQPDEPTDPWDPRAFRYTDAEHTQSEIKSRRVLTKILVRSPSGKEWFRLHPSPDFRLRAALYLRETEDSIRPETYLVHPQVAALFGAQLSPVMLHLGINSLGTLFLWPRKTSTNGRVTDIQAIQEEIALEAEQQWVRMEWSNGSHAHIYHVAEEDLGDPDWPADRDMAAYLKLGFKGTVVDSVDHGVVAEFLGRRT